MEKYIITTGKSIDLAIQAALTELSLDENSRKRVEEFDSAKIFADDPDALKALVALGFTEAMKSAASNQGGSAGGFAGLGLAGSLSGNTQMGIPAVDGQMIPGFENCPFCGTLLYLQTKPEYCPACNADISSYFV